MEKRKFEILGVPGRRKDGVARVTGREKYTVDISLPRMLHGRILSSPYAHARVKQHRRQRGRGDGGGRHHLR